MLTLRARFPYIFAFVEKRGISKCQSEKAQKSSSFNACNSIKDCDQKSTSTIVCIVPTEKFPY